MSDNKTLAGFHAVTARLRQKPDTVSLRAYNDAQHHDERIDLALVPVGDGLTLARKR